MQPQNGRFPISVAVKKKRRYRSFRAVLYNNFHLRAKNFIESEKIGFTG
jgi:hypothetical protein